MHDMEILFEKVCKGNIFHVEGSTQQRLFALEATIDICLAQASFCCNCFCCRFV